MMLAHNSPPTHPLSAKQYWMLGGVLFTLTTWVDDVIGAEKANAIWLGSLLFIFFWLYFPLTCGALIVYDNVTEPFLGPRLRPLQKKMSNFIVYLYQTLANAVHLYLLWIIFMFLPAGLKRIIAVATGTVYPFVCSVTAAATDEIEDDTYCELLVNWILQMSGMLTFVPFLSQGSRIGRCTDASFCLWICARRGSVAFLDSTL